MERKPLELTIYDASFREVGIVDHYESLIWTERYSDCGDFEISLPVESGGAGILLQGEYAKCTDSDRVMFIEDYSIESSLERGAVLTVTGRSLESLLDRRIVWNQTVISGDIQNGVQKLLNENVIFPNTTPLPARAISNFVFRASEADLSEFTVEAQYVGDNLLEVIKALCDVYGLGFRITLSATNQFVFQLCNGVDRSYEQETRPYVIFSPEFENLLNSKYLYSKKVMKNVTLVAGEEKEDAEQVRIEVSSEETAPSGLDRREMYTDAGDVHTEVDGVAISAEDYAEQLQQRGLEELSENAVHTEFEGQMEPNLSFIYGSDYFIGDIVEVTNEYGISARARIIEYVRSQDCNGLQAYPTFATLE